MRIHNILCIKQSNFPWHFFKILKLLVRSPTLSTRCLFWRCFPMAENRCSSMLAKKENLSSWQLHADTVSLWKCKLIKKSFALMASVWVFSVDLKVLMKRTVSRMRHFSLQRHFFKIENCWFRFLSVKVISSRRCFLAGEGVVGKGVAKSQLGRSTSRYTSKF